MILTCERCETRFRLDESRLPPGGARVRCSRCKHAFFVNPAGALAPEAVHQRAEAALTQSRQPAPAPSWDLEEDPNGRTAQSGVNAVASVAAEPLSADFEEESDWRFEDEMQLGDTGASLDLPNGEAPAPPSADRNESSFADLGDPESWDLLSTTAAPEPQLPRAALPVPAVDTAPRSIEHVAVAAPTPGMGAREERIEVDRSAGEAPAIALEAVFSPALQSGAWIAVTLLVALASWSSLAPLAPAATQHRVVALGELELDSLRVRQIENVWAGPIWVVSGELHNPSDAPRAMGAAVGISLLDSSGAAIDGASAIAQSTLPAERLREADPAQLHEAAEMAAAELGSRSLAPGARVAVDAVFAAPARGAARFAVETLPLRQPPAASVAVPAPIAIDPALASPPAIAN